MKIDFLIYAMAAGGAERVVSILGNNLAAQGHEVRIITFTGEDHYDLNNKIERIKLHNHPLFKSVIINGFFSLLLFYRNKKNRPDIISSHINLLGLMTIPIAKLYRLKIVVSEHSNHLAKPSLAKRILWNLFYPFANAVTILTNFDYDFFKSKNKNVVLMPNPCSFKTLNDIDLIQKRKKEIVAMGVLDRYFIKGFDNLIPIAAKVLSQNPGWNLKIVGQGEKGLKFLKNEAIKFKINDRVIFTGFQTNIQEILKQSEIFILCSRYEGLPMALLEAMSQGTACISYNCISGPSDIITHNYNGLLIKNQDHSAMAVGLNKLIQNEDLRLKFRVNAPKSLELFSIENVGKKWMSLFRELTKQD